MLTFEKEIPVLDHGYVRLIDYMGGDLSVVRAARVSYDADWRAGENEKSDIKLINFLWKNKHTTPFEAVTFTFEIKAPIFIFRQWHRHRTWSYNEVSARYTELPCEYYVPKKEHVGEQSSTNKQARIVSERDELIPSIIDASCSAAFEAYKTLLEYKVPRELARSVLPVATYSHMFATVNLLNLLKFLTLRLDAHAQYEIQQYAGALLKIIKAIVPECIKAWELNK